MDQALVPSPWTGVGMLRLAVKLSMHADSVEWRLYTPAMVLARKGRFENLPAGWSQNGMVEVTGLHAGLYYLVLNVQDGRNVEMSHAKSRLMVLP